MIKPNLTIEVNGLSEENEKQAAKAITAILKGLIEVYGDSLDLSMLDRIILSTKFNEALAQITVEFALGEPLSFTKTKHSLGVGQVVMIPEPSPKILLLLNAAFVSACLKSNATDDILTLDELIHLFHHELSHVHDYTKRFNLNKSPDNEKAQFKDELLVPMIKTCWAEYWANFFSARTAPKEFIVSKANSLMKAIPRIDKEIGKLRAAFLEKTMSIEQVVNRFSKEEGLFLIREAAYLAGYLDGLKKPLGYFSYELKRLLQSSYFLETWISLRKDLKTMRKQYPNSFESTKIYSKVKLTIESYFNIMGFELENVTGGTFVRVIR